MGSCLHKLTYNVTLNLICTSFFGTVFHTFEFLKEKNNTYILCKTKNDNQSKTT